jgi:hypothetical protein
LTSGATMEPKKLEAVKTWPRLTDKLHIFLKTYHHNGLSKHNTMSSVKCKKLFSKHIIV